MPGLSLLSPLLLATAAVALVPLLLHFFSRKAARTLPFSTLAFLRQAVSRKSRQFKMESRNLLILRLLAVLLVAVALARPVVKLAGTAIVTPGTAATAVIILDNSLSMATVENARQRFDRAQEVATDIVRNLAEADEVAVLLASSQPVPLLPEPSNQLEEAVDLISNAPLSYGGSNLRDSFLQALDLLESVERGGVREIYILTDMQASAWEGMSELGESLRGREVSIYLCDVGKEGATNNALTGVRVEPSIARPGTEVRTIFQATHFGQQLQTGIGFLCHYGPNQETRMNVDLPPGDPQVFTFRNRFQEPGIHTGYGRLDDDILEADNTRYFATVVTREREVLVLDGRPGSGEADGSSWFLTTALRVMGEQGPESLVMNVTVRSAREGMPEIPFIGYDLVVLSDVPRLSADDVFKLRNFAEGGGGVMVFLGPNVNADNYNSEAVPGLIPGDLDAIVDASRPRIGEAYIRDADYGHSALNLFRSLQNGDLRAPRFQQYWRVQAAESARVLARLQTRDPLLLETAVGRGIVWTFASTADEAWNDFPEKKIYLPFWVEAAQFLSSRTEADFMFEIGESVPVQIQLEESAAGTIALPIIRPDGSRDSLQLNAEGEVVSALYTQTTAPGIYRIQGNGFSTVRSVMPSEFVVNTLPAESDLTRLTDSQRDEALAGFNYQTFETPNEVAENLQNARAGTPLWGFLLLGLLLLLTGETFYSQRVWR